MDQYYYCYSSSSSSKKLMMIIATTATLLLIITTIGAIDLQQGDCSKAGPPVDSGPCQGTYPDCVDKLIRELASKAPDSAIGYTSSQSYPDGYPSGGVTGEAICVQGNYEETGCRKCLLGLKQIVDCSACEGAWYANRYCLIRYNQIP